MDANNNPYSPPVAELGTQPPKPSDKVRPTSITVVCIIGFLGAIVSVLILFSGAAQAVAAWYPAYLALASVVGLICFVGLWRMKKMAAYGYTALVVANQVVLLAAGRSFPPSSPLLRSRMRHVCLDRFRA